MTELLAHRGPDDSGHVAIDNVGLGHRRLSVIDTSSAGHQPMSNGDGSLWIVYNGECYNFRELAAELRSEGVALHTHSDTEVLLKLYQHKGVGFLARVRGMFALAIWDRRSRTLLLARDRIGIKPLYVFRDSRHLVFASELKGMLADPALPTALDLTALSNYLHLLSIPGPSSILEGVRRLEPGHYILASEKGVIDRPYWDLRSGSQSKTSFDSACAQFDERFADAVRSHLVSDVPVGAFLSGGVDSSSVVAVAARQLQSPIQTFSVTFPAFGEFDEGVYARQVATHCASRHFELELSANIAETIPRIAWHADEPFAVSSAFALHELSRLAREHVKVVLTGDGADEVFGGYLWRHVDFPTLELPREVNRFLRVLERMSPSWFGRFLSALGGRSSTDPSIGTRYIDSFTVFKTADLGALLTADYAQAVASAWTTNVTQRYFDSAPYGEQLARKLFTDIKTTLVSEMLTKVDRMTMAHGLEARVPFLDHELVEWAFRIPGEYKVRGRDGKALVKRAMERYVPADVLYRPKHGFNLPMRAWLRNELKPMLCDLLSTESVKRRGIFVPEQVEKLIAEHLSGEIDHSNRLIVLLMLELWYTQFMDDRASFTKPPESTSARRASQHDWK